MLVDVLLVEEPRQLRLHMREHTRLKVDEQRTRDVLLVVGLVKEDVLAIAAVRRKVLEDAILADAVLKAQLLPELHADLVAALAHLQRDDLARLRRGTRDAAGEAREVDVIRTGGSAAEATGCIAPRRLRAHSPSP